MQRVWFTSSHFDSVSEFPVPQPVPEALEKGYGSGCFSYSLSSLIIRSFVLPGTFGFNGATPQMDGESSRVPGGGGEASSLSDGYLSETARNERPKKISQGV